MSLLGEAFDEQRFAREKPSRSPDRGLLIAIFACFLISTVLLLTGIIFRNKLDEPFRTVAPALGIVGLAVTAFLAEYRFFFGDWGVNDARLLARSFFSRDRRGRRLPGSALRKVLESGDISRPPYVTPPYSSAYLDRGQDSIFSNQPDTELLSIAASEKMKKINQSILRALNAGSLSELARYSDCSVLTKLDLVENSNIAVRQAAAITMPRDLWSRALYALLRSKHPDARIAAVSCHQISRRVLIKLCSTDPDNLVRRAAGERLESDLSADEAVTLRRSPYADCRTYSVSSGKLPRNLLIESCKNDKSELVRKAAYERIKPVSITAEAEVLRLCPDAEIRSDVIDSGLVPRNLLFRLCLNDEAKSVREVAFKNVKPVSTPAEAKALRLCPDAEIRSYALQSGLLPRKILFVVCCADEKDELRLNAWNLIRKDLNHDEAALLSRSGYEEVRLWAVESGLLSGRRLWWLSRRDKSPKVKSAARFLKLRVNEPDD